MTRSRSGLMALVGGFMLMIFFSKSRKIAMMVVVAGIIVAVIFGGVRLMFQERLRDIYAQGTWGHNIEGRFETWRGYFETATPQIYMFGQGFTQARARNEVESHSAYVSLITVYGLGGTVWAILSVLHYFKKVFRSRNVENLFVKRLSDGCLWVLVAWGIYAMASDAISSQYSRYLLFYIVILVDRTYIVMEMEEESEFYYQQADLSMAYSQGAGVYY